MFNGVPVDDGENGVEREQEDDRDAEVIVDVLGDELLAGALLELRPRRASAFVREVVLYRVLDGLVQVRPAHRRVPLHALHSRVSLGGRQMCLRVYYWTPCRSIRFKWLWAIYTYTADDPNYAYICIMQCRLD